MSLPVNPTEGEVVAVVGSPGPATGIRLDVAVTTPSGEYVYRGVYPFGLPLDFDIIIDPQTPVGISYRGTVPRFWCVWRPVTTECTGGAF